MTLHIELAETVSKTLTVLVIDDNRDAADSLANVIQSAGHDARAAYTATAAAKIVAGGFDPDAIFMDIGLPEMDGYSVARELCTALPRKPLLVAVTGFQNLDGRSRKEDFDVHFVKPVEPELILSVLAAHAEQLHRSEDQRAIAKA